MKSDGKGDFKLIPALKSGLLVKGDVLDAAIIFIEDKEENNKALLIAKNNDTLQLIKVNK